MKVTIETISTVEKKLNFEIPLERVNEEFEKMYRSFQLTARIKGFRPGKAPRSLIERQFGDQVTKEVETHLVEESYAQAIDEYKLPVVTHPHLVTEKVTPGQSFRYSAVVEVRPEVSVSIYEGLEAEKLLQKVHEQEVEDTLRRLAESFAQLHPITDRTQVENGDMIRLDFAAFVNDKPIPGLQGKERLIDTKTATVFPGFQDRLIGARKGSTLEFALPFPQSPENEESLNRIANFRVTIHELLRKEVPHIDDEFAKDHGECETLEELREKIRQNLQQSLDRRAENQVEDAILSQLIDRNPFEVPPSLIRGQEKQMLVDAGLLRPEEDLSVGKSALPDQMKEEFLTRARKQIQSFLLLDALANQVGIAVSEEEIQQRIEDIIIASGVERRHQIEGYYKQKENRDSLERRLQQEKTLHFVIDKAQDWSAHFTN